MPGRVLGWAAWHGMAWHGSCMCRECVAGSGVPVVHLLGRAHYTCSLQTRVQPEVLSDGYVYMGEPPGLLRPTLVGLMLAC